MTGQTEEGKDGFVSFEQEEPKGPFVKAGADGFILFEDVPHASDVNVRPQPVEFNLQAIGVDPKAADLILAKVAEFDEASALAEPDEPFERRMLSRVPLQEIVKKLTDGELLILFGHTDPSGTVTFHSLPSFSPRRELLEAAYLEYKKRTEPVGGTVEVTGSAVGGVLDNL